MTVTSSRRASYGADLLLTAIASVSWAFLAMAAVAALGLHLLGADAAGALGPMTAAVVVLAVGGSLTPTGSVEAFGLTGAGAHTTVDIAPLGVSLVGALLLGRVFARSLRPLGPMVRGRELAARAAAVAVLFLLLLGGLAWAGSSTITFDGSGLNPSGSGGGQGGLNIPGVGDVGNIGGGLPDRLAGLAGAKASVGFSVRTGPSLLGGAVWVLAVLLITVLAARRAPLPRSWQAAHRTVRPAASALCTVLVLAVVAGLAAAAGAATADDHPGRVLGGALLGAPNGVWLGVALGLFVPFQGTAAGSLLKVLPDPLPELLRAGTEQAVTVGRLAGMEPLVWLLPVGCALMMLTAGVLTAARTPRGQGGAVAFALRRGVALAVATGLALPLLVLATRVTADASLSVLGVDAFGAGLKLSGSVGVALLLGLVWGFGAGVAGGLLVCAVRPREAGEVRPYPVAGPYSPSAGYRPAREESNPYLRQPGQVDPYTAPTETGPMPPPRPRRPGYRYGSSPVPPPDELPPPPPPPRGRG
ncbi:streptophobe family protein [Streptomyces olivoverticillatus]|uniref:streptophobe family protein n=1 Tax=Streptomyces olivoverticillatus TaxID=66427 RepID=UPI00161988E8|nr:streptophobe family protein [Streptomyces olivoverticillatus]